MFRLGRAVVKVTAKDRDVLDICSDQPALWSMRVAMTGRLYKFGGWRVKLEVKLLYTLREVLAAVAIITRHVIGPWDYLKVREKSNMQMGHDV